MRSVAVACVKNEIDIVEAFVRHALALADHLIVLDNGSQDGTTDILDALVKEGLSLEVLEDPSPGHYQSQRMTCLMREHAVGRCDADWVLLLDADEFLVVAQGASLLPKGAATDRPLLLPWRTYVPDESDDASEENPLVRMRRWRVADQWEPIKVMVPRALAALPNASLVQGNHGIDVDARRCDPRPHGGVWVAHFPLRSPGQYAMKIAMNSLQYHAMATRDWESGHHYQAPFELLKQDLDAFNAGFIDVARRHGLPVEAPLELPTVVDPLPYLGGPLRYTPRVDDARQAWYSLLHYAEDLARRYAGLAASLTEDQKWSAERQAAVLADLYAQLEQRRRERADHVASTEAERVAMVRSWTWRIGRLVTGPAAWATRTPRRCVRAVARRLHRPNREPISIPRLEMHVAHSCNLRCESCSHYTNHAHRGIVALAEADRWMKLWKPRVSPAVFTLAGGEPALHPRLTKFIQLARQHWPRAKLRLISNGFLLERHRNLPIVLRDTNTNLCVSVHHSSPEYEEKLQPVRALVDGWAANYAIEVEYLQSYAHWTRRYHGFGAAMRPFDDGQPRASWEICPAKDCPQLFEGQIWKCAPLAYLPLQARKFHLSGQWTPYLDYRPLPPDCTSDELRQFFARQDEQHCNMCPSKPAPFELPLPLPTSASRESRRLVA
jgi:hypothetical protein